MAEYEGKRGEKAATQEVRKGDRLYTIETEGGVFSGTRWVKTWEFSRTILGEPTAGGSWTPANVVRLHGPAYTEDPCDEVVAHMPGFYCGNIGGKAK